MAERDKRNIRIATEAFVCLNAGLVLAAYWATDKVDLWAERGSFIDKLEWLPFRIEVQIYKLFGFRHGDVGGIIAFCIPMIVGGLIVFLFFKLMSGRVERVLLLHVPWLLAVLVPWICWVEARDGWFLLELVPAVLPASFALICLNRRTGLTLFLLALSSFFYFGYATLLSSRIFFGFSATTALSSAIPLLSFGTWGLYNFDQKRTESP